MITVDISNIWGEISLYDLLGTEQEVFLAHKALTEEASAADQPADAGLEDWIGVGQILSAAERIREESDILVVLGTDHICHFNRAVLELLQGPNRNLQKGVRILFAPGSLSTRAWNELTGLIQGQELSVCVLAESAIAPETAIALRGLKWLLERKYGTDEARQRIYAVTGPGGEDLRQTALDEGWMTFQMSRTALSHAALLPLGAAGLDIRELIRGASDAWPELELLSFENPAWLYAGARNALYRSGRYTELLITAEPGFAAMGHWWQQLFTAAESGPFPGYAQFPMDFRNPDGRVPGEAGRLFETILRFEPSHPNMVIARELKDLGGLNALADQTLNQVCDAAFQSLLDAHTDKGIPLITMDCGPLNERTLGRLYRFFLLSSAIFGRIRAKKLSSSAEM